MSSSLSLKALYYPYSRCTNENTLKRAVLFFDEIWFVDPTSRKMRENLITDQREILTPIIEDWLTVRDSYGLLIDEKVVKLYDPEKLIKDNDKLLSNSLKADLNDNEVWKLCTAPGLPETWSILRRKVPPSAFEFLNSQHVARLNYGTARAKAIFHKEFMEWPNLKGHIDEHETNPFPTDDMDKWYRYLFHDGKVARDMNRYGRRKRGKEPELEFSCIFPFTHGSSLVVNQALLISDQHGLIPFTDNTLHHQLLNVKYQRAVKNVDSIKKPIMSGAIPFHPEKMRRIALTLFDAIVPDQLLDQINIKDTVEYREKSKGSFERLKEYMGTLASQIESEIWDDKFEVEIQKMVNQKIVPEARKAQDDAIEIYEKLFGKLGKTALKAVAALTPTIGASVFAGLTFPLILLVGSAGAAGAILPDLIDSYLEEKKSRRNSLAYLVELKSKTSKRKVSA